jgi:Sulfotransferase family
MTRLSEHGLHDLAVRRTGLSNFGDSDYLEGLREVLAAVCQRPRSEKLDKLVEGRVIQALTGRLYSERNWRAHPGYAQVKITAPIMITGMSRSGTSALHQLLAMDEQFQWIPHWIAQRPTVRRARELWPTDPAYIARAAELEDERRSNPAMRSAHNIEAELPEECINVMSQSFITMTFITTVPLPRYRAWFFQQDETSSYQRYADNLRLIGMEEDDRKPWLLKNPSHTGAMQALLSVFPDARIIVTHRDPVEAVSSGTSLTKIVSGDLWEPGEAGRTRIEVGLHNVTQLQKARDRHPNNFHDVYYRQFMADPMTVVTGIYRRFGLALSPAAETRMRAWIAQNPQGKFGKHRYSAEQLELDTGEIRRRFANYIQHYQLS